MRSPFRYAFCTTLLSMIYVICCGIRRSGSTLNYKLVRAIIEESGVREDYRTVKTHRPTEEVKWILHHHPCKVVFTYRDLRDVVSSDRNLFRLPRSFVRLAMMHVVSDSIKDSIYWGTLSDVLFERYESFSRDLEGAVHRLAHYLSIELSENKIKNIAATHEINVQKALIGLRHSEDRSMNGFDPALGYFKEHIRQGEIGRWKEDLSRLETAWIESVGCEWLRDRGYVLITGRYERMIARALGTPSQIVSHLCRGAKRLSR